MGDYFQIKAYTGTGSAHAESFDSALDTVPGFGAIMNRTEGSMGRIGWHISVPNTDYMTLNSTDAASTLTSIFNSTSPTTTQFTIGTWGNVNNNTKTYIAYYWANSGPYAFGDYVGTNSVDGPVFTLNGHPEQMMWKTTDRVGQWSSVTAALQAATNFEGNMAAQNLYWNLTNAESATNGADLLSNGAKIRESGTDHNVATAVYIYGAFGIQPLTDGSTSQGRAR